VSKVALLHGGLYVVSTNEARNHVWLEPQSAPGPKPGMLLLPHHAIRASEARQLAAALLQAAAEVEAEVGADFPPSVDAPWFRAERDRYEALCHAIALEEGTAP